MEPGALFGLTQHHLVAVDEHHWLHPDALDAFEHMRQAAQDDNVDLSIASSFRSFQRQCVIWNEKWRGQRPIYNSDGKRLAADASDKDKLRAILAWSALPGVSRHHWGTDVDVFDQLTCERRGHTLALEPAEYSPAGPCGALNEWLDRNAAHFGFYRPFVQGRGRVSPEPWHLSHGVTAAGFSQRLTETVISNALEDWDIEGKSVIRANLGWIFDHYVAPYRDVP